MEIGEYFVVYASFIIIVVDQTPSNEKNVTFLSAQSSIGRVGVRVRDRV